MAIDTTKLEDEILLLISTKKKLTSGGGSNSTIIKEYLERINILFLEGQVSADAYKLIVALYTGKLPTTTPIASYRSSSC